MTQEQIVMVNELHELIIHTRKLTEWERDFVLNMYNNYKFVTPSQQQSGVIWYLWKANIGVPQGRSSALVPQYDAAYAARCERLFTKRKFFGFNYNSIQGIDWTSLKDDDVVEVWIDKQGKIVRYQLKKESCRPHVVIPEEKVTTSPVRNYHSTEIDQVKQFALELNDRVIELEAQVDKLSSKRKSNNKRRK